jgi:tRNA A37 methylthiotransferase MiaB
MHTATRLAVPVIKKVRALNPSARLCAYGLYAPLNEEWLRSLGVDVVLGGEFEEELAALAHGVRGAGANVRSDNRPSVPKLHFITPDRSGLLPLNRYATVHLGDGRRRVAGYTEASRGCRHLCRHCPVVPIYNGQFRVIQQDVVLADVAAQVAAGAEHITFGDPDFFNGPTHAVRIVEALHHLYPSLTYDVTIKVEHLLQHVDLLPRLRETGCLFVTTAVESLDDRVLKILEKGHTRADFVAAVDRCREADLTLVPTFVAFHPWMSLENYCDLVDTIAALDLVDHVAPIQLAIRLLIPRGSRLLELDEVRTLANQFDSKTLSFLWAHPDPRVDALQSDVAALVGRRLTSDRRQAFDAISTLAHECAGTPRPVPLGAGVAKPVPFLDEPWYCCAEPNPEQLTLV